MCKNASHTSSLHTRTIRLPSFSAQYYPSADLIPDSEAHTCSARDVDVDDDADAYADTDADSARSLAADHR